MTLRLNHDRLLIKRIGEPPAKEGVMDAIVLRVGVMNHGHCLFVKPGDVVLVSKYTGVLLDINGEEHVIIRLDDVLAVRDAE